MTAPGSTSRRSSRIAGAEGRHAAVTTSMAVTASGLAAIRGTLGSAQFVEPFVFPARFVVEVGGDRHEWEDASGLTGRAGLAWQTTAIAQRSIRGAQTPKSTASTTRSASCTRSMPSVPNSKASRDDQRTS